MSPKLTILIALTLAVVLTVAMSAWPGLTGSAESAATDSTATPAQSATTVGERGGPAVNPRVLAALEELNDRLREQEQVTAELRRRIAALTAPTDAELADAPGSQPPGSQATPTQRLLDNGFTTEQARAISQVADDLAMSQLNLRYQARREGWDLERWREESAALPNVRDTLTERFGADAYDRYLYATGRPNRVVVQDVMENSPAAIAGLRPGDTLVSAANRRIHSTRDLLQAANSGPVDEAMALRVRRGNSTLDVYVPRGPLGVRTSRGYENPVDGT